MNSQLNAATKIPIIILDDDDDDDDDDNEIVRVTKLPQSHVINKGYYSRSSRGIRGNAQTKHSSHSVEKGWGHQNLVDPKSLDTSRSVKCNGEGERLLSAVMIEAETTIDCEARPRPELPNSFLPSAIRPEEFGGKDTSKELESPRVQDSKEISSLLRGKAGISSPKQQETGSEGATTSTKVNDPNNEVCATSDTQEEFEDFNSLYPFGGPQETEPAPTYDGIESDEEDIKALDVYFNKGKSKRKRTAHNPAKPAGKNIHVTSTSTPGHDISKHHSRQNEVNVGNQPGASRPRARKAISDDAGDWMRGVRQIDEDLHKLVTDILETPMQDEETNELKVIESKQSEAEAPVSHAKTREKISLKFVTQDQKERCYLVFKDCKLGKLFAKYTDGNYRFQFDGDVLQAQSTPEELDMVDEDMIDVIKLPP